MTESQQRDERVDMQSNKQKVFSYFVTEPNTEVTLVFALSEIVSPKSIVAKIRWLPENTHGQSKLELAWSNSLDSYFAYVPEAETPGLKYGPTLLLDGPGTLEVIFLSWPARTPLTDGRISGLYVRTHSSLNGQVYSGLQRILEVGMTR